MGPEPEENTRSEVARKRYKIFVDGAGERLMTPEEIASRPAAWEGDVSDMYEESD